MYRLTRKMELVKTLFISRRYLCCKCTFIFCCIYVILIKKTTIALTHITTIHELLVISLYELFVKVIGDGRF